MARERSCRGDFLGEIRALLGMPDGRVALVDFIHTRQCVDDLRRFGVSASRTRDARLSFWTTAILHFGFARTYFVLGTKVG